MSVLNNIQAQDDLYQISLEEQQAILAAIDIGELTNLALDLGNIPSQSGHERQAAEFVHQWLKHNGFASVMRGVTESRPNVIGQYGGHGDGLNLFFGAHLDTESPTYDPALDQYKFTETTVSMRDWKECWLEDGHLRGFPVTNDRGPMSCFLMAAKALKKAGIRLSGKMYLTASPGEIGPEPIEEFQGIDYLGKEIGTHYLFNHGGISPDYAIVAEGTDFGVTWQASGYALFKISLIGSAVFTPVLHHPARLIDHPNPIHRLGFVIDALTDWAKQYEVDYTLKTAGGVSIPKSQIDALRAGLPHTFGAGTEICSLYLDVTLPPLLKASVIERALTRLMRRLNVGDFTIEPLLVRHGFKADDTAVAPLVQAVDLATQTVLHHPVQQAHPVYSSMWRDHNVFNMNHVPAITCGMPREKPTPQDLFNSTYIYALTTLAVCGRFNDE